jgi:hypothetical protein
MIDDLPLMFWWESTDSIALGISRGKKTGFVDVYAIGITVAASSQTHFSAMPQFDLLPRHLATIWCTHGRSLVEPLILTEYLLD